MDELPKSFLIRRAGDTKEHANVVQLTRKLAQTQTDTQWWQLKGITRSQREAENDHGWQWAKRIGEIGNNKWFEKLAAETKDGRVQGAILYRFDTKSFLDDRPALHVEALATAPWNRPWLTQTPEFRGVGEGLIFRAVLHSYLLGFGGVVNLFAFDESRCTGFYENLGFEKAGVPAEDDERGLVRLELAEETASEWMVQEGYTP